MYSPHKSYVPLPMWKKEGVIKALVMNDLCAVVCWVTNSATPSDGGSQFITLSYCN